MGGDMGDMMVKNDQKSTFPKSPQDTSGRSNLASEPLKTTFLTTWTPPGPPT